MRVLNIKIFPHHTAKHRSLQAPIAFFITLTLLLTTFPAALYSQPLSAANGAFYDFISNAPSASWYSGAGSLSFPGSEKVIPTVSPVTETMSNWKITASPKKFWKPTPSG